MSARMSRTILLRLIQAADGDVERAQTGIIYIDEIDKITRKGDNPSITRDVSGEGVQQALLKIIEGCIAHVPPLPGRKHPQQEYIAFDTTERVVHLRRRVRRPRQDHRQARRRQARGWASAPGRATRQARERETSRLLAQVTPDDLLRYGLIPEFIGRLPVTGHAGAAR